MLDAVYRQEFPWILQEPSGQWRAECPPPRLLFPGSFNPLHAGHTGLARRAAERLGVAVAFEISIANVDKPDLPPHEVRRRLDQFRDLHPVYLTRAATFREKAALFPGCVFVVGADTAVRVIDPRFYGDHPAAMLHALDEIRAAGCRFLVGGRIDAGGRFVDIGGIAIPTGYDDLFAGWNEHEFRVDVSSTELRTGGSH